MSKIKDFFNFKLILYKFIKNIIPDRMKVKLAIIDCIDRESAIPDYEYPDIEHIDHWKYSPEGCDKLIESVF